MQHQDTSTSPVRHRPSLAERLGSRDNALNLVRFVLAAAVIFGHAFPLGGYDVLRLGPFAHGGYHGYAVNGFFVISGFLIFASALRMPILPYLWRRFLRIYPGYIVALLAVALLFAPLGAWLDPAGQWEWRSAAWYVLGALDLKPSQDGIGTTLSTVPWPGVWNGSLWTLFYEGMAYIGAGLLALIPWCRRNVLVTAASCVVVLTAAYLFVPEAAIKSLPGALSVVVGNGLRLGTYFAWGMLAYALADRIRPRTWSVAAAVIAFVLLTSLPFVSGPLGTLLIIVVLVYGVLGCGAVIPLRWGSVNDLSYGTYLYAFPVQQILILLGSASLGWFANSTLVLLCTIPFALASWYLVERPALEMKRLVPARRKSTGALPSSDGAVAQQNG